MDIFTKFEMAYTALPDRRNKADKLMKTKKTIRLHLKDDAIIQEKEGGTATRRASRYA